MVKQKKLITLNDEFSQLLDRAVGEAISASDYLARITVERWNTWTEALYHLRDNGWTPNQLLAACDALNATILTGVPNGRRMAANLSDAERYQQLCAKWEVPPSDWAERVKEVAKGDALAHSLQVIAAEFWVGNDECQRAIRDNTD